MAVCRTARETIHSLEEARTFHGLPDTHSADDPRRYPSQSERSAPFVAMTRWYQWKLSLQLRS